jgi:hypothetical protein
MQPSAFSYQLILLRSTSCSSLPLSPLFLGYPFRLEKLKADS